MWLMFVAREILSDLRSQLGMCAHLYPFSFHPHLCYTHIHSVLSQVLCTELKASKRTQGGHGVVRGLPTSSLMTFGGQ